MDLTYLRLVENQPPPGGFGDIPWQDDAVALICGVCQLICSAYFAFSAYSVATRKKLLVAWCGLLMATIFFSAFFRAIIGLAPTDWFDGAVLCPRMTFLWLIGSLLLDFSIAVTILSHLRAPARHRHPKESHPAPQHSRPPDEVRYPQAEPTADFSPFTGSPRAPILSRLLTTLLTSFSLTAILMFSLLLLVLAMHGTEFDPRLPKATGIFTALRLLTTPTYAITFLYTLNRRKDNHAQPVHPRLRDFEMQIISPPGPGNWPTFFTSLTPPGDHRDSRNKTVALGWTSLRRLPFRRASAPLPPPIHVADSQHDSIYHTRRPPFNFLYPTVNGSIVFQF
ncbi:hypothetical protein CROQUDRAFT_655843 [Cronartium quercuum f. sp. fusiforme G11]|uniref:Uncharacterized protein n=1 Tax=Cronartium quercuum f. sp. fusiforme G11 TaxID=708437 RepID=A0A9P6NLA0_9BASI|nr:hypothetical protein CROQUDRAFT_655843 [Cronartium quercuum f. sp. fusiforme G11]